MIDLAAIIKGGMPILLGTYATALGFEIIEVKKTMKNMELLKWIKHLKWIGPLTITYGFFIGWQAHTQATHPSASQIAQQIRNNISLPLMLDDATQLDSIEGIGNTLTSKHTVFNKIDQTKREKIKHDLQYQLIAYACNEEEAKALLASGYTFERIYTYQGESTPISVSVSLKSC